MENVDTDNSSFPGKRVYSGMPKWKGKVILRNILEIQQQPTKVSLWLKISWFAGMLLAVALWVWACGALRYVIGVPGPFVMVLFFLVPWALTRGGRLRNVAVVCVAIVMLWMLLAYAFTKPRGDLEWEVHCSRSPAVRVLEGGGRVEIHNVRQFKWHGSGDFDPSWTFQTYYMDQLQSLDLVVEPLGASEYFAHTMLSFGFGAERRVVISIEVRREKGESFGILPGFYRQFELFYQINSERDAFTLRATRPDVDLYVFPVKAEAEFIRSLFLDMVREANQLNHHPQFYHSLRANCTTKLFDHVNMEIGSPIGYRREILLPAQAGKLLHELGWMDTDLGYQQAKERFRLGDKVKEFAEHPEFSRKIRQ
ncbi:MAG: DUF4105 domain-containing protein [Verrucomicrobiales bacterium]